MKRKKYMKPSQRVIELQRQCPILAASGEGGVGVMPDYGNGGNPMGNLKSKNKMKTMKNNYWMAALLLTAATLTACTNEDNPVIEEPDAQQARVYTLTTTLSPQGGETTRSTMVDNNDGTITATWQLGDKVWVSYDDNGNTNPTAQAEVIAVDETTKAATIRVSLTDPKNGGNILFGFPYAHWNENLDPHRGQLGTLTDINKYTNVISGGGSLTVSDNNVTLPAGVTMTPEMCIWKFTFKDGETDITSAITKLTVSCGNGDDYVVMPSSESAIYVAIYADTPGYEMERDITITAWTATGIYAKYKTGIKLTQGKMYTTPELAMDKPIGYFLNKDGSITKTKQTSGDNVSYAVIAHVGAIDHYCDKFIAIALKDVNSNSTGDGSYTFTWTQALQHTDSYAKLHPITINNQTFSAALGFAYDQVTSDTNTPSNSRTGSTTKGWRIPTVTDWRYIFAGLCNGPSATDPMGVVNGSEYGTGSDLLAAINTACGNDELKSENTIYYWTSSVNSGNSEFAWAYNFYTSKFGIYSKTLGNRVRAVFVY